MFVCMFELFLTSYLSSLDNAEAKYALHINLPLSWCFLFATRNGEMHETE